MSSDPWEEMTRRWREMYQEHAALAQKNWLDGQTQLATALAGGTMSDPPASAAALAELWRSWTTFGGSLWRTPPGVPARPAPARGAGRMTEPLALSLAGGGEVGDTIRRMTEGPRFADIGAAEHRMAKVIELWMSVQTAARTYESVVAGAWAQANTRFAERLARRTAPEPSHGRKQRSTVAGNRQSSPHRDPPVTGIPGRAATAAARRDGFLLAEREFVEALVEPAGLPTRTEMDEVHRTVQELKRRVKALERAAAATSQTQTTGTRDSRDGPTTAEQE